MRWEWNLPYSMGGAIREPVRRANCLQQKLKGATVHNYTNELESRGLEDSRQKQPSVPVIDIWRAPTFPSVPQEPGAPS